MDLALLWDPTRLAADIAIANGDLAADDGLQTAVILSLFTNRPARADDVTPDGTTDRGGWWGDSLSDIDGDHYGSRLWLLRRTKLTDETLRKAKEYAEEALAWLLEDQVASEVTVAVSRLSQLTDGLGFAVFITRPNGPARQRYDYVWRSV